MHIFLSCCDHAKKCFVTKYYRVSSYLFTGAEWGIFKRARVLFQNSWAQKLYYKKNRNFAKNRGARPPRPLNPRLVASHYQKNKVATIQSVFSFPLYTLPNVFEFLHQLFLFWHLPNVLEPLWNRVDSFRHLVTELHCLMNWVEIFRHFVTEL